MLPKIDIKVLDKYAPVDIECDLTSFSSNEQQALCKLRQASILMDEIFLYQNTGKSYTEWKAIIDNNYAKKQQNSCSKEDYLRFFDINMGVWDRLSSENTEVDQKSNSNTLLTIDTKKKNFYPSDLTIDEYNAWLNSMTDEQKENARSYFTIIQREQQSNGLICIPFSKAYEKWLQPAKALLLEAAKLLSVDDSNNGGNGISQYLIARANAFESNNYIPSDILWLNMNSVIDVTIGPYETYEDEFLGIKASFESFVCIKDIQSSNTLQIFAEQLQELENNLPCDEQFKNPNIVQGKPIVVVDEICIGGDRGGPQTAAFNLPNDEKVTVKHGNKLVILRNIQRAKFNKVLKPISEICLNDKQKELVSFDSFFNHILCHEMCHSLGPHELKPNADNCQSSTVRQALGSLHSALEEAKADIAGLYSLLYMIRAKGLFANTTFESVIVTFLASAFRSIRFGLNGAHGKGQAIQLNWILEKGGFVFNAKDECFSVNFNLVDDAIQSLVKTILEIQGRGDVKAAQLLCDKYGVNAECTKLLLNKLSVNKIPVDIQPNFQWKFEKKAK